jgi:hypothetical protein
MDVYARLCTVDQEAEAGHITSVLKSHGLHPFAVCPSSPGSKGMTIRRYSIQLPEDEIKKGRKVLAIEASKEEMGLP